MDARKRWYQFMGNSPYSQKYFNILEKQYSEPHRHHHHFKHILEGLAEMETIKKKLDSPIIFEYAWWFHDSVYDPARSDNEEQSAALALPAPLFHASRAVEQLILATKKHTVYDNDSAYFMDIDYSILGQNEERYTEYAAAVRQEYVPVFLQKSGGDARVANKLFNEGRKGFLQHMLKKEGLFTTQEFSSRYQKQAEMNMKQELTRLS